MINQGYYKTLVGLKRRRFSLWETYNRILDEVLDFNNIKTYKLIATHEGWTFDALIQNQEIPIFIYVEQLQVKRFEMSDKFKDASEIWNFGFEVGHGKNTKQFKKTVYKEYVRIIATVGLALKKFITSNDPEIVTLFSESKKGGIGVDAQKDDVYFSALNRNKFNGYELDDIYDQVDKKKGIMLYKISRFKGK